ncbi:hypothetical protein PO909_019931 [Leuciscus waleckii]
MAELSGVKLSPKTILGPAKTGLPEKTDALLMDPLQDSREQSNRGESVQAKPLPGLYHGIQPQRGWMSEGEPKWTVGRPSRRKQLHFHWSKPLPYQLHHLWMESPFPGPQPLPRQDVCSLILNPRDIYCSYR